MIMPVAEGEWGVDDSGFASHVDGLLLEATEGTLEPVDQLQGVTTAYAGDDGRLSVSPFIFHAEYAAPASPVPA